MKDSTFVYIEICPLAICSWASDPTTRASAAKEALRAHISGHDHGQLVEHVFAHAGETEVYQRNDLRPRVVDMVER